MHEFAKTITAPIAATLIGALALTGCTSPKKEALMPFCVITQPDNVGAVSILQTIQNTTLQMGVTKEEYKSDLFTFAKVKLITPDTNKEFEGTVEDAIKIKLAKDTGKTTDWRNASTRFQSNDLAAWCYVPKGSTMHDGAEITPYEAPTSSIFDTQAVTKANPIPKAYKQIDEKYPESAFKMNTSYSELTPLNP